MGINRDLVENERPTITSPNTTEANTIGIGQIWQDVTASRAEGVTYTNNTGKPILVYIAIPGGGTSVTITTDGVATGRTHSDGKISTNCFIVPNGSEYVLGTGVPSIFHWSELR